MRTFNTTGLCIPEKHYMVDISERLQKMKEMVDKGQYFTINRGRQYGKTTTLYEFGKYLGESYVVLSLDFQAIGFEEFQTEQSYVRAFSRLLLRKQKKISIPEKIMAKLEAFAHESEQAATLNELFFVLSDWCEESEKPVVLFIDEVDSASSNQVFLDFLAQLRYQFLEREQDEEFYTFQSVILVGVTDVKNLKRKLHPGDAQKVNSPWNIAVDFTLDMNLSTDGIAGMLSEYMEEHHITMDTLAVAQEIRDYTGGYPFLVSRICQIMDSGLLEEKHWTEKGVGEAAGLLVQEGNTLFDSLMGKVVENSEMGAALQHLLFSGEDLEYNRYNLAIQDAMMYGFIKVDGNKVRVANRIFEMLLYNYFLAERGMQKSLIYRAGEQDKELFITDGHLNMEAILEHFVISFHDIYGGIEEKFDEEEGRRRFLLYIRPIINGTGNYYIEAQTRNQKRMDVVIDYMGERFVIELKIWRGNAYHERGEKQLLEYLDYFRLEKGYMLSYNFNQKKKTGVQHLFVGEKMLIEAVV